MKRLFFIGSVILLFGAAAILADTTTSRFGLTKPDVGSTNWGPKINTNSDLIDNAGGLSLTNTWTGSNTFQTGLTCNQILPSADATYSLGNASNRWADFRASSATINHLLGTTTNDSATAGTVGEYLESATGGTGFTSAPNNVEMAIATVTLTGGDWDLEAYGELVCNSGTTFTANSNSNFVVSNVSAGGGVTGGKDILTFQAQTVTTAGIVAATITMPRLRVSVSGSTPYYLNVVTKFSGTAPNWRGTLTARRVR